MPEEKNEPEGPGPAVAAPAQPSPEASPPPRRGGPAGPFFLSLLVSLAVSVLALFVYDRFIAQKVVAIDMKGYIAEQRELYLAGRIGDEELRRRLDRLEEVSLAIPANRVVLMGDAVVRNVEMIKP
jgi:hypothetical protein